MAAPTKPACGGYALTEPGKLRLSGRPERGCSRSPDPPSSSPSGATASGQALCPQVSPRGTAFACNCMPHDRTPIQPDPERQLTQRPPVLVRRRRAVTSIAPFGDRSSGVASQVVIQCLAHDLRRPPPLLGRQPVQASALLLGQPYGQRWRFLTHPGQGRPPGSPRQDLLGHGLGPSFREAVAAEPHVLAVEVDLMHLDVGSELLRELAHCCLQAVGIAWMTVNPSSLRSSATMTSSISRPSSSVPTYTAASASSRTSVALTRAWRIRPALSLCLRADRLIRTFTTRHQCETDRQVLQDKMSAGACPPFPSVPLAGSPCPAIARPAASAAARCWSGSRWAYVSVVVVIDSCPNLRCSTNRSVPAAIIHDAVSYTHLTLPTNRE